MSVANFIPEIWSQKLLVNLRKDLVGMGLTNQDYQGDITQQGDTVKIISPSAINVGEYDGSDITFQSVTSGTQDLEIDQSDYIAFTVDNVDQAQANVNLMDAYIREGNYSLSDATDEFIFGLYTGADSSNVIEEEALSASNIYDKIVEAKKLLSLNSVPKMGRWIAFSPDEIALLEASDEFISASDLGDETKQTGFAGRVAGFEVFESNNVVEAADIRHNPFGHRGAITFASQITSLKAGEHESKFADFVKGLHVYGAKVARGKSLGDLRNDLSS